MGEYIISCVCVCVNKGRTCFINTQMPSFIPSLVEVRRSSMVRPFTHSAMGHGIDTSWWTH